MRGRITFFFTGRTEESDQDWHNPYWKVNNGLWGATQAKLIFSAGESDRFRWKFKLTILWLGTRILKSGTESMISFRFAVWFPFTWSVSIYPYHAECQRRHTHTAWFSMSINGNQINQLSLDAPWRGKLQSEHFFSIGIPILFPIQPYECVSLCVSFNFFDRTIEC